MSFFQQLSVRHQGQSLLVLVFLILAGCAKPIEVKTDYDPAKDFSAFRTYAWHDRVSAPDRVAEKRIRTAVETILYQRGYRYLEPGTEPDFRVSFTAVAETSLPVEEVSSRLDYGQRAWSAPFSVTAPARVYTQGTLIIDIIEPVGGGLLWRGVSSRSLDADRRQRDKGAVVSETVRAILQLFPPRSN